MTVPLRPEERGKRERESFPCLSATKSMHHPGRRSRGSIRLLGFPACQKLLDLEFVKLCGSEHKFVTRRSLVTGGKLPGEVRYRPVVYNSSTNTDQLKRPHYVVKTVRIHISIDVINLCIA